MSSRKNLANKVSGRELQRLTGRILRAEKVRNAKLDIFLLSNREMTALKARFIKKRTEPNVLAFPEPLRFPHPETKRRYLGEVYLNRDIVRKTPERTTPLLVHGILHLLGYDHKRPADIKEMETLEKKIVSTVARAV